MFIYLVIFFTMLIDLHQVGQKRLVSYVVPTEFDDDGKPVLSKDVDTEMFAQHCREFLKKKLPQYMVCRSASPF